jgi:quercetin dioxygenase-like cupin family protein
MRNFLKIAENVDVLPILNAIYSKPDLWDENRLRTTHELSPHRGCHDIWCFFNAVPEDVGSVVDDTKVIAYRAWSELPQIRPVIFDLMRRVEGTELGRVIITKIPPGGRIPPHTDQGAPVEYYTRYQIVLQSLPGAVFQIEDEKVNFRSGDVWRIDNSREHQVVNNSADDRVVIITDIRSC